MDEKQFNKLQRLGALRANGALTEEEFVAQKTAVLGVGGPDEHAAAEDSQLKKIERLRQSGALSDEESAAEKARILEARAVGMRPQRSVQPTPDAIGPLAQSAPISAPAWAAKSRRADSQAPLIIACVAILVIAGGGFWWWQARPNAEESYTVTSTANVRTAPTTENASVLYTLTAGQKIKGEWVAGRNGSRWLRIEGDQEAFVWDGNLRSSD